MQLKKHFGNKLDVYGRGINDFGDKWDVIAPYKYHIVIENSRTNNYFTEKITDVFLGMAFPIYYGCPNLASFFPDDSFAEINIHDFEHSVKIIENSIASDYFDRFHSSIEKSRQLSLEKYNMFNMMAEVLDSIPASSKQNNAKTIIQPCNKYSLHNMRLGLFDRNMYMIKKVITRL